LTVYSHNSAALSLTYLDGAYAESVIVLSGLKHREDGMSSVMVFCPVAADLLYSRLKC
jgi:hypothetical protein